MLEKENIDISVIHDPRLIEQAMKVRLCVFVDEQKVPKELERDQYESVSVHFIAMTPTKEVVATLRLRQTEAGSKIERLAVLKEFRGKNIGHKLMKAAEDYIIQNNLPRPIYLYAQTSVLNFYSVQGYKAEGEFFIQANIEHQKMVKGEFSP